MKKIEELIEDVVAGDSGGTPDNIAAGTTTGSIVNKGPEVIGKKDKKQTELNKEQNNKE